MENKPKVLSVMVRQHIAHLAPGAWAGMTWMRRYEFFQEKIAKPDTDKLEDLKKTKKIVAGVKKGDATQLAEFPWCKEMAKKY
jgi:hypothetical protein